MIQAFFVLVSQADLGVLSLIFGMPLIVVLVGLRLWFYNARK